jgi:hypothetical protein
MPDLIRHPATARRRGERTVRAANRLAVQESLPRDGHRAAGSRIGSGMTGVCGRRHLSHSSFTISSCIRTCLRLHAPVSGRGMKGMKDEAPGVPHLLYSFMALPGASFGGLYPRIPLRPHLAAGPCVPRRHIIEGRAGGAFLTPDRSAHPPARNGLRPVWPPHRGSRTGRGGPFANPDGYEPAIARTRQRRFRSPGSLPRPIHTEREDYGTGFGEGDVRG